MSKDFNLKGHLLVAMPGMEDNRFSRTVIFICNHDDEGAMGFIMNHKTESPTFNDILDELKVDRTTSAESEFDAPLPDIDVFSGGPVEQGRGFVIHSFDFNTKASVRVGDLACVTATLDALKALAGSQRPRDSIMLLGYSGWGFRQMRGMLDHLAFDWELSLQNLRCLVFGNSFAI